MKRRDFLNRSWHSTIAATVGASSVTSSLALQGCSSFDRLFSVDRENKDNEVFIIGAGAAGLMAGLELKKKNIPYRLFEASPRIGGRIYSLEQEPNAGEAIELGAEFFSDRHQIVFDLAQELNLELEEVEHDPHLERLMLFSQNRWWSSESVLKNFKTMASQMNRLRLKEIPTHQTVLKRQEFLESTAAQQLDQMTMPELLKNQHLVIDPFWNSYLEADCQQKLGASFQEVSALSWLLQHETEEKSRQKYRIKGGFLQLTYSIYERLAGVIPEYRVRLQCPLIEISLKDSIYRLKIKTPQGTEIFETKYVIIAVPFAQLKNIQGLAKILNQQKLSQSIEQLNTSKPLKHSLVFKEPFWRKKSEGAPANQGQWLGGAHQLSTWDSSPLGAKKNGILSVIQHPLYFSSGLNSSSKQEVNIQWSQDILRLYPKLNLNSIESSFSIDWSQREFIQGDKIVFRPGQLTTFLNSSWTLEKESRFQLAGDYTLSHERGTVSAALESGRKAAQVISEIYRRTVG